MKKAKQWVAAVLAASMVFSQTVYAQEYAAPESAEAVETTAEIVGTAAAVEETEMTETVNAVETEAESIVRATEKAIAETEKAETEKAALEDTVPLTNKESSAVSIGDCVISGIEKYVAYDGTPKTMPVTVIDGEKTLEEGEDYTISYKNNTDVGTASLTIKGNGTTYVGEKTYEFDIIEMTNKLNLGDNYVYVDTTDGDYEVTFTPQEDGYYRIKLNKGFGDGINLYAQSFASSDYSNEHSSASVCLGELQKGQSYEWMISSSSDYPFHSAVKVTVEKMAVSGKLNNASWNFSDGVLTLNGTNLSSAKEEFGYPWECFRRDAKKIIVGAQVQTIPSDLFAGYDNTESVELPNGLTTIGDNAFRDCLLLKDITLPETVKTVGYAAFIGCGFNSIRIPASVEEIGGSAFGYSSDAQLNTKFCIVGQAGSGAETYAKDNDIAFVDEVNPTIPMSVCDVTAARTAVYDGKAVEPAVKVFFNSKELVQGTDYTVTYADNTSVGTGRIIITGIGQYTGSVEQTFEIKEQKVSSKTMVPGSVWFSEQNFEYDSVNYAEIYNWSASDLENVAAVSSNPTVCAVTQIQTESQEGDSQTRQTVNFKVQAYKTGTAELRFKDTDGTVLFTYQITVNEQPEDAIVFEDPVLQCEMVTGHDSDGNGYLTKDELSKVDENLNINCIYNGEEVHSLKGIENFTNVRYLTLSGCYDVDYSALSQLPDLIGIYFSEAKIDNLGVFAGCKKLSLLHISDAVIGSMSGLENLEKLTDLLLLNNCAVESWDGLEKLTHMTSLAIRGANFTETALLSRMQNLEVLNLANNHALTDIRSLVGLKKLRSLNLDNTGVPDEDKWNFADIPDEVSLLPGEIASIEKYEGLLDLDMQVTEGSKYVKTNKWSSSIVGLFSGTAKIHVTYTDTLSKDITVHIGEMEDQTLDDAYEGTAEISKINEKNMSDDLDVAHILDSNGNLWSTTPKLKKVQSSVKQYVADYVYASFADSVGSVKRYLGYYLDNDNVLWSDDHQKIAEDIVKAGVGGALDSKGNFYDLHMESPQPISGVVKWAAAPRYTLILKKDGSVWERNAWAGEKIFSKLDEDVIDIVIWNSDYGAYLKSDGTVEDIYGEKYNTKAVGFGTYYKSYYDKDGKTYLLENYGDYNFCIGNLKAVDIQTFSGDNYYGYLILTEDGSLYSVNELGDTPIKVDSGVDALNPNYENDVEGSWRYRKDGKYYRVSDNLTSDNLTSEELSQVMIKYTGYTWNDNACYLYNYYDGHEQAVVKYGVVFIDHVTDIWTDQGKTYALRTDGSVWDITNSPTKIGSLSDKHEHTVVTDAAVEATLDSPGKTEGSHCSECGEIITAQKSTVVTVPLTAAKANAKGGVDVSWKKVSYADGYLVYRKSGKDNWKRAAELKSADDNSWTDTTGTVGTAYTYTVRAYMNADGETVTGGFDSKGVTATVLPATVVLKSAADNGKNGIAVNWEKVTGATGYRIYRKTAGTGWKGLATVASDSTTNYTDNSVTAGTTYSYTVRAYKTVNGTDVYGGFDNTGVSASVKKSDQTLGTVVLDKVTDSTRGGVIISWKAVDGAEGYRIFKKFTGSSWQKVTDVTADKLSYEDASGVTGKTYTYTVRAYKMVNGKEVLGGFDSKGLTAKKLPAKVTLKEAKADNNGAITVRWNKLSTATGYRVYRKEAGGSWKGLTTLTANTVTSYTDKAVTVGKSYTYTVRAYKAYEGQTVLGSFDADGKTATAKAAVAMPSTVKLVSVSAAASRKITVSWEKADNCEGYVVYRKEAGKSWTRIAKAGGSNLTSYTDSTGTAGTTYTYTVRAYKTVNGKEVMGSFDANGVSAQCKN